jgi:hypothetical protein
MRKLNFRHVENLVTCTTMNEISLKKLLKIQLAIIKFLRKQFYISVSRDPDCLICICDMIYSTISCTFNPNAAVLKIALELSLEILGFGLDMLDFLYTNGSKEFPDAESFHNRLFDFALGYFASGMFWHTI